MIKNIVATKTIFWPSKSEKIQKNTKNCGQPGTQNSLKITKILIDILKRSHENTLTPKDHQADAKVTTQDSRMRQKQCRKTSRNQQIWIQICLQRIAVCFNDWMQTYLKATDSMCWVLQIFQTLKNLQLANYQSADCRSGQRQGRSLQIYIYTYIWYSSHMHITHTSTYWK